MKNPAISRTRKAVKKVAKKIKSLPNRTEKGITMKGVFSRLFSFRK